MLKEILLPVTGHGDQAALQVALGLAEAHDGHLVVLITVQLPVPISSEFGALPMEVYAQMYQDERERGRAAADVVRDRLRNAHCTFDVRTMEVLSPLATRGAGMHARHADLTVLAAPPPALAGLARDYFPELLMDSGRPVLVVPAHAKPFAGRKAVVAWQPTAQAARAVHDALDLLAMAASVDVLLVDPSAGPSSRQDEPGAEIAAHLARHGLPVQVVVVSADGDSVAKRIVRHAVETDAGWLVAGGYSHSRLREFVLGGTTRTLLFESPVPVLFSH